MIISGNVTNTDPPIGVSTSSDHYPKRNSCINQFTHIFGANTLHHKPMTNKYPNFKKWAFPFKNKTVLAKKAYFDRDVLHKENNQNEVDNFE